MSYATPEGLHRGHEEPIRRSPLLEAHYALMFTLRDYDVEYCGADGKAKKVEGTLIHIDRGGFIVIQDKDKRMILIPRDRVICLHEQP